MSISVSADIKLSMGALLRILDSEANGTDRAVDEVAAQVVQECKRRSRVRTGAMRRGWNRARIGSGRKAGWRVYDTVPWTIYNEFGTYKMRAQPMLTPAMRAAKRALRDKMRRYVVEGHR